MFQDYDIATKKPLHRASDAGVFPPWGAVSPMTLDYLPSGKPSPTVAAKARFLIFLESPESLMSVSPSV